MHGDPASRQRSRRAIANIATLAIQDGCARLMPFCKSIAVQVHRSALFPGAMNQDNDSANKCEHRHRQES